jgi:hypothetical protein
MFLIQLSLNLYRENLLVASGYGGVNETTTLSPGTYLYVCNTTGNENYTAAEVNTTLTVVQREEARKEMRVIAGYVAAAKIEKLVERAEQVELTLETKIDELRAAGEDTTELEATLEDFSAKVELARELIDEAESMFENGNAAEGHKTLREAAAALREAFRDVKEIVKEMRKYRIQEGKIFFGNETGEVWVRGNGTAEFVGTGIVIVKGNATLEVEPKDAVVTLVGFSVKSVEGGVSAISGEGKAVIRGENVTVKVEGEDIKLIVKGYGVLTLDGRGMYRVKESPQAEMSEETPYDGHITIEFGGEQQ